MNEDANLLKILSSALFPGIGHSTAKKVVNRLNGNLTKILDEGEVTPLLDIITLKKSYILLAGWKLHKEQMQVVAWLDEHGIDSSFGSIVWSVWGKQAIDKLEINPYRLLAFCTWNKVDRLGKQLGIPVNSHVRLIGAIEQAAYDQLEQGNTVCTYDSLYQRLLELLPQGKQIPENLKQLITSAIKLIQVTGALIEYADGYQIPGAYYAEREIESWYNRRQTSKKITANLNIPQYLKEFEHRTNINLTDEQINAVKNALFEPVSIFYGGAGVGKTFTLKAVCDAVESLLGMPPVLLALAAKAVRKMSEMTGREAMTIARCLYHKKSADLANRLIIIDEASMIDLLSFKNLIRKLPDNSHLVLVGDPAQLPSIGAGNVLHDFLAYSPAAIQKLTQVHRQAAETGIPEVLEKIRKGYWPDLAEFDWNNSNQTGITTLHVPEYKVNETCEKLIASYNKYAQIISPLVQSKLGTRKINECVHFSQMQTNEWLPGTPIVFTSNEHLKSGEDVDNGLTGRVASWLCNNPKNELTPWLLIETEFGHRTVTLGESERIMELAWALSVHKSQGSSWETVITVLPPHKKLLTRDMVYTALSRCEKRCICIIPDQAAVTKAVAERPVYEKRITGLFR